MKKFSYVIKDEIGIHARPTGEIAKEAQKYESTIILKCGEKSAEAQKLFALMMLGVKCGEEVEVIVEGDDEKQAFEAMKSIFEKNL